MATIPQPAPRKLNLEEAAAELYRLLEEHFDEMGLTEAQRDARYAALDRSLDARDIARRGWHGDNSSGQAE